MRFYGINTYKAIEAIKLRKRDFPGDLVDAGVHVVIRIMITLLKGMLNQKNILCPSIVPTQNLGKGTFIFINANFCKRKIHMVFYSVTKKGENNLNDVE